jgi:molybdate transport system regulatory protein
MPRSSLQVSSSLSFGTARGALASRRWLELLASIGRTQSISAAAKDVGLSYKAAWDAVESMNNLADAPLVQRAVGGRGGGGTTLTAEGERLVATFSAVEVEHAQFLSRLNARIANADRQLRMIGRLNMMTSARNHFAGKVARIRKGAVNDEVEIKLSGGERLTATITHQSVENLGLRVGAEAVALIKASWVIVAIDEGAPLKLSARNRLAGVISQLSPGAINTEVVIALKGGNSVVAVVTNESAKTLKLAEGMAASAIFKASSVILGVAA